MRIKLTIIILLTITLFSCSNNNKNNSNTSYTFVTLKGPSSLGIVKLADSLVINRDSTLKIKIVDEPMIARKMMLEGTADFCALPTTMAAVLYNKGFNYKLIAVPVWGTLYLFGNKNIIVNSWNDLKGKRIYVIAKGMTPDLLLQYLLRKNGVNPHKDVTLDYSFPTHIDLANAVAAGRAEIGIISEPYVSLVMQKNPNIIPLMDLNTEWSKIQGISITETALLVKSEIIENNPQFVDRIINDYKKSTIWVNEHHSNAAELIVKFGILPDTNSALRAIPYSNLNVIESKKVKDNINDYLKVFYNMAPESIGGKLPDEKFYY
jgi:ABC-type nitrate/sulfonate/bicarbonate transport systems, periplasmic components